MDTTMKKIMLVEQHESDHCVLTNYLSNHFRKSGIEIEHAATGQEALSKLAIHPAEYAAIIADQSVSKGTEAKWLAEIQRNQRLKNIPVVIVDYYNNSTDQIVDAVVRHHPMGLYDYIPKAFDRRSLLDIIDRAVGNICRWATDPLNIFETEAEVED